MKDYNKEQRRAKIGEWLEEQHPQIPSSWFGQTVFAIVMALVGVVMFLAAIWFFGIIQILII